MENIGQFLYLEGMQYTICTLCFICSAFPPAQAWACHSKRLCNCSPYSWQWESEVFSWWTVGHQESVWFCATSLWQTYLKTKLQQITFTLYSIELMWHMRRSCGMALILTMTVLQGAKAIVFRSFWYSFHAWTEEWYFLYTFSDRSSVMFPSKAMYVCTIRKVNKKWG